jgi:glycosyltransferase involved in cell wall biosynthesis
MLSWEYPPHSVGGLGKHVQELVPALARKGIEIQLVTPRRAGGATCEVIEAPSACSVTIHRVDLPSIDFTNFHEGARQTNLALEACAREVLAVHGPFDLIHAHDWLVAFAGIALKHATRTPLLATIHATEYGRARGHLSGTLSHAINHTEWWLAFEAWRLICCSRFMASEVHTALGAPADKIDVIPNGVDTRRFDVLEGLDLTSFRAGFARPDETIIFYVGRVVHEKGVHLLVQAMPRILTQRPNVKLVVAGTGDSVGTNRQLAHNLGVGAQCYFAGFIPDDVRDRLFRVADVGAFPSLYEPFGIVALEAMAARLPVVVAEVGGLAEVVQHAETAITVFPNSVDSLAWGILHTLDHPDWAGARAKTAYAMVVERYNWGAIAAETLATYERIVAERGAAVWT